MCVCIREKRRHGGREKKERLPVMESIAYQHRKGGSKWDGYFDKKEVAYIVPYSGHQMVPGRGQLWVSWIEIKRVQA